MPREGDFFLAKTTGWKASVIRLFTGSRWNHAGIIIHNVSNVPQNPRFLIAEMVPDGGAIVAAAKKYKTVCYSNVELTEDQRTDIADLAYGYIFDLDTGYNWLDVISLGLAKLKIKPRLIKRVLSNKNRLFCSQMVDEVYLQAGIHLFDDGRLPGQVTPGDLERFV